MSALYEAFVHECYRNEARIAIVIVHPDAAGRDRPFPSSKAFALMLLGDEVPLGRRRGAAFVGPEQESPLGRLLREHFEPTGVHRYTPYDKRDALKPIDPASHDSDPNLHVVLAEQLIEQFQLIEADNNPQTEEEFSKGLDLLDKVRRRGPDTKSRGFPAVFWKQRVAKLPHATYLIRVSRPDLLQHLKVGMTWAGASYDP